MEASPSGEFEDARTLAIWNRNMAAIPPFHTATVGNTTTIDTGAEGVLLTYVDDGLPFSSSSLSVLRRTPSYWGNASLTWRPTAENMPGADPGQLFGTFHTLDDNLDGFVGLNCSLLDPNNDSTDAADFFPCNFGVLSKGGFALLDDSKSPVWEEGEAGWLRTQDKAVCGDPKLGTQCFSSPTQDTTDPALCHAAGCCMVQKATLSLWYSAVRDDHFSDNQNCSFGCDGFDYVYMHAQGLLATEADDGLQQLNLYWNPQGRDSNGATGDNMASTFPPTQV